MNPWMEKLMAMSSGDAKRFQMMVAPLIVVTVLVLMVLPLPPLVLDIFFTFNIAMSLMVMMVAATMLRPLDFAAFPEHITHMVNRQMLDAMKPRLFISRTAARKQCHDGCFDLLARLGIDGNLNQPQMLRR